MDDEMWYTLIGQIQDGGGYICHFHLRGCDASDMFILKTRRRLQCAVVTKRQVLTELLAWRYTYDDVTYANARDGWPDHATPRRTADCTTGFFISFDCTSVRFGSVRLHCIAFHSVHSNVNISV